MLHPFYYQLDAMDCGPTCLRMIARHYGRSYSLQNLRERCHITREGVSMLGISDAAESIGFRATGVKITWEQLRDEMPLPCIVHWNQRHFVVIYEVRKRRGEYVVKVADPVKKMIHIGLFSLDPALRGKDFGCRMLRQVLDEVIFLKNGHIVLQNTVDEIRKEHEKSVDGLFREVFKW